MVSGLGSLMRSITLGAALRISPLLGLTALAVVAMGGASLTWLLW